MLDATQVSVGLAFLAGLASFLSPCCLSLVPAYVGYLGGRAVAVGPYNEMTEGAPRWTTLAHGFAFVLGFSVVFVALGAAASAIGVLLYDARDWLAKVGGIVVIVFGLHTMGVLRIPLLDVDTRRQSAPGGIGYLSSAMMGMFFSAGWWPCVGPVLGAVLTMALTAEGVGRGALLLSAYSAGLGIPFLLAAAGLAQVSDFLRRHGRYLRIVSLVTGAFLIVIGVMLFFGTLQSIARFTSFSEFQYALDSGVVEFWNRLTGRGG